MKYRRGVSGYLMGQDFKLKTDKSIHVFPIIICSKCQRRATLLGQYSGLLRRLREERQSFFLEGVIKGLKEGEEGREGIEIVSRREVRGKERENSRRDVTEGKKRGMKEGVKEREIRSSGPIYWFIHHVAAVYHGLSSHLNSTNLNTLH